jgi:hypothetical protein
VRVRAIEVFVQVADIQQAGGGPVLGHRSAGAPLQETGGGDGHRQTARVNQELGERPEV